MEEAIVRSIMSTYIGLLGTCICKFCDTSVLIRITFV